MAPATRTTPTTHVQFNATHASPGVNRLQENLDHAPRASNPLAAAFLHARRERLRVERLHGLLALGDVTLGGAFAAVSLHTPLVLHGAEGRVRGAATYVSASPNDPDLLLDVRLSRAQLPVAVGAHVDFIWLWRAREAGRW